VLILGPAANILTFGPIFYQLYVPMIVAAVAGIVVGSTRLSHPHWTKLHRFGALLLDALGLGILYVLSRAEKWFVLSQSATDAAVSQPLVDTVNSGLSIALPIALVAAGVTFAWKHGIRPVRWRRAFSARRPTASG
jgi:hypothetical protein